MANFHSRSNSLPSQSHPLMDDVQLLLCRLKSSQNTSISATCISANLATLTDLHQGINNLIQMPSIQQAISKEEGQIWMNELLEGSLGLVDLCAFSRDVLCSTKESVQELESSLRRSRGETANTEQMNAYVASRKKMNKMVNKCLKNLKSINQKSTALPEDVEAIGTVLKETESLGFSVLKSILTLLSGVKDRSNQSKWSLISKFTKMNRVFSEGKEESYDEDMCILNIQKSQNMSAKNMLKQLNSSEMKIQEVEEGVESLFRSLLKTRVFLLNVLTN